MRQGMLVEIGGKDFRGPIFEQGAGFLQQQHLEGIGFLSCGAARTPNAQATQGQLRFGLQDLRDHHPAQGIQLCRIAKEAGFPNRDLVQQCD